MKEITIIKPSNMHAHVRQLGDKHNLMPILVPLAERAFHYYVCMPNTTPPIKDGYMAKAYGNEILSCLTAEKAEKFSPIVPLKLLWNDKFKTTLEVIVHADILDIRCAKLYLRGTTTNSDDGVALEDLPKLYAAFKTMAEFDWILQIHGENPSNGILAVDREYEFHQYFKKIHEAVPNLKIVYEHISDRRTIELIRSMPANIAGTLSTHFMYMTLNDVVEPGLRPNNSCKPIAKRFEDMEAIIEAATSGDPKFFLGSDSAPHIPENKYKDCGACGCFLAPYDLEWVVQKFDERNALHNLEKFVSINGPTFYGLTLPESKITLTKTEPYRTEKLYHGLEIWKGGEELSWKIKEN